MAVVEAMVEVVDCVEDKVVEVVELVEVVACPLVEMITVVSCGVVTVDCCVVTSKVEEDWDCGLVVVAQSLEIVVWKDWRLTLLIG